MTSPRKLACQALISDRMKTANPDPGNPRSGGSGAFKVDLAAFEYNSAIAVRLQDVPIGGWVWG